MLIKFDTDAMHEMAACAKTASQYVEESSEIAYRLIPHNDWNCQERDYINEGIQAIRKHQAQISERFAQFSDAISQVAAAFLEAESALPNLFNEVDACVGEIVSLGGSPAPEVTPQMAQIVQRLKSDPLLDCATSVIDAPSPICSFPDIVLEGGGI